MKIALAQMEVAPGEKRRNLERASLLAKQAAGEGAGLILFPEVMELGWTDPSARTEAESIPDGTTCRVLKEIARGYGIYVCAGLVESAGSKIFNAAVLIDPEGQVILRHRKLNELEIAHDLYAQGDRLQVAETPWGRVGLMICSDAFASGQVVSRALGYMGAGVILSPSSWAVDAAHDQEKAPYGGLWLENYAPVARDFRLWIASVSNVGPIRSGPWKGRKCIGCSMIVGPDGEPVLRGPYGENAERLLFASIAIAPRPARGDQWAGENKGQPVRREGSTQQKH